jgi:hypothetical protein
MRASEIHLNVSCEIGVQERMKGLTVAFRDTGRCTSLSKGTVIIAVGDSLDLLPFHLHARERTTRSDQCLPIRPLQTILGLGLDQFTRITQRQDNRPLATFLHTPDHILSERPRLCRTPDENGRLDRFHDVQETDAALGIAAILPIFPDEVLDAWSEPALILEGLRKEPVAVDKPKIGIGVFGLHAIELNHGITDLAGYSQTRGPSAEADDALGREFGVRHANGGHESREGDSAGSLTVEMVRGMVLPKGCVGQ